jgi:hypothetical protein
MLHTRPPRRWLVCTLGGFLLFLSLALATRADDPPKAAAPDTPAALPDAAELVLDLAACRKLALEKQPALAAYRTSLAAAQAKVVALDNLGHLANVLRRDLCIRKRQAALGVVNAEARLHQAEVEAVYSATRLYWSVVFTAAQLELAEQSLKKSKDPDSLWGLRDLVDSLRRSGQRGDAWLRAQFDSSVIALAEGRREEARQGLERAKAALREAIGLAPGCPLRVLDKELPSGNADVTREQIVHLALDRRAEIAQAGVAVEVTELEIQAQCLLKGVTADTFAANIGILSSSVAPASFGDDYRPGGVGAEMPGQLVGPPCQRVEQARLYHQRALAVLDKTRGLIALDADNAYLKWVESKARLVYLQQAYDDTDKEIKALIDRLAQSAKENDEAQKSKATVSDLVTALAHRVYLRGSLEQARLQVVLNLASLERVTGGGFCPVFEKANGNGPKAGAK